MTNMRIVVCYPVEEKHLAQLRAAAPGHEIVSAGQERIAAELLEADIFCGHAKVPVPWPEVVRRGRLRWIQSSAAGLDHCLTPEVVASSIVVSGASGLFANQVAEQTLALLLGLLRGLPTFFRAQQKREFIRRPTGDLHGQTIGILGFGGNGRRLAEVLAAFDTRILATDLFPIDKPAHVEALLPADRIDVVLPQCDTVVLCVPLTTQTRGFFAAEQFAKMKRGATFINVARGECVVERDLISALQSGQLSGAGVDVTQIEPLPADSPLWELPNVIITPHVGAQSHRRVDDTTELICENLRRYFAGRPLLHVVDKQLGFAPPDALRQAATG